jgi:inhibitor of cysteine peptidase
VIRGISPLLIVLVLAGPAVAQEAEAPPESAQSRSPATIESLDLEVIDTYPVAVLATVTGHLPDACSRIDLIEQVTRESEGRIEMVVETWRDPERMCAAVLTPFEMAVPLDAGTLLPGIYRVEAGESSGTFELPSVDGFDFAPPPGSAERRRIFLPEVGVTFDAPGGWERDGLQWASSPFLSSRIGVRWHDKEQTEAEQLLPSPAKMHETSESRFGWAMGVRFRLSRDQQNLWSEHVFVACDNGKLCELWLESPSEPLLEAGAEPFWRLQRFVARYDVG